MVYLYVTKSWNLKDAAFQLMRLLLLLQTLQAECNKFKMEEVPPRLEMKKKLFHIYDEIQVSANAQCLLICFTFYICINIKTRFQMRH